MRRMFQACAGLIIGGMLLSSVGCQSGGGWGQSPGSYFSNWKAPTWPQPWTPWSSNGGTSLASSKTPSSSATPTQPQSSVTNPAPSGYAGGPGGNNWGPGYPGSTQPQSGYDPNAGYAGANYNTASANNGYSGGSNNSGTNNAAGYSGNGGYNNPAYAAPAGYTQPANPPTNNYQQETPYGGGGYNNNGGGAPGGYNQGGAGANGYNASGTYNTSSGNSGYNGYQGSQNVQPPAVGYEPVGYGTPSPRAGAYNEPAGNNYTEAAPTSGAYGGNEYAAQPSNAAVDSTYQVQPASAQEPIAQDPYAAPPAEVAGGQGVLSGSGSLPSSLSTPGGYRPGSTGGTYMR